MFSKAPLEKQILEKKRLYSHGEAQVEANRCLYCYDAPCIKACPTSIDIPSFIKAIATQRLDQSARRILLDNILGHSCAHVCPVEVLCAEQCVMHQRGEEAIQIGRLQRFATHHALKTKSLEELLGPKAPVTGKRVACVGAGPASLALAGLLVLKGHAVEIFEARSIFGGLNATGIAPYKMHADEALLEVSWLIDLGVIIHENSTIDSPEILHERFDAIFIGKGMGDDTQLPILPQSHPRVWGATHLIRQIKTEPGFSLANIRSAHVIGGGNTAIDIAHTLVLLGVDRVTLVYRRSREEMSAYQHEIDSAVKDGIHIWTHDQLRSVEPLPDSRLKLFFTSTTIETDLLVVAIGQMGGVIKVDPLTQKTEHPGIWAGGDCTNGGKEVVNAVAEAKIAAESIHHYLQSSHLETEHA